MGEWNRVGCVRGWYLLGMSHLDWGMGDRKAESCGVMVSSR